MDILQKFDSDSLYIINALKKTAISRNINIYLVGGAVRDAILNIPFKDMDFCLNCDPKHILPLLPFNEYTYNKEFKTAKVIFNNLIFDLILIRKEYYEYSGALPKVKEGNLYDDLFRRDFTINSLAYDIKRNSIIDYFSGLDDLCSKKIRKVHHNSYREDGTRIFRAVKYKVRYGFIYHDKEEIREEIKNQFLSLLSNDRIIKEIISLLKEDKWIQNILELYSLNIMNIDKEVLNFEYPYLNSDEFEDRLIRLVLALKDDKWIDYLMNNAVLNSKLRKSVINYYNSDVLNNLISAESNYEIYLNLTKLSSYDLKFLICNKKTVYKVINYIKNLSNLNLPISGQVFKDMGYKGKEIGNKIKEDLKYRLNTLV